MSEIEVGEYIKTNEGVISENPRPMQKIKIKPIKSKLN